MALRILRLLGAALAFAMLAAGEPRAADAPATPKRIALVVGNGAYKTVDPLSNPPNDARLIAGTLTKAGFELVGGGPQIDLDKAHFDIAVQQFGRAIPGAEIALFYYSGHGLQVQGTNWLVPVDANPTRPQDLDFQMVDADLVLRQMDGAGAGLNLLILDACRNNPFGNRRVRGTDGGLAEMHAPEGTLISYATQPGNTAQDGSGDDSPFTLALADAIALPGLDIFNTFNHVGLAVKKATGGTQQPWLSSSPIEGSFSFQRTVATADAGPSDATKDPVKPAETGTPRTVTGSDLDSAVRIAIRRHDYKTAMRLAQKSADQGSAEAMRQMGALYHRGLGVPEDNERAMQLYQAAAAKGDGIAMAEIGFLYQSGQGVKADYVQALSWGRRAADAGAAFGMNNLGQLYRRGLGVPEDRKLAAEWFRRGAEAGSATAMNNLGRSYERGEGIAADPAQAIDWFKQAAAKGSVPAMVNLGLTYERGHGVAVDKPEAIAWFRRAANRGDDVGKRHLAALTKE